MQVICIKVIDYLNFLKNLLNIFKIYSNCVKVYCEIRRLVVQKPKIPKKFQEKKLIKSSFCVAHKRKTKKNRYNFSTGENRPTHRSID